MNSFLPAKLPSHTSTTPTTTTTTTVTCTHHNIPLILSYPILSYPILSYPILSYPILSYPILSYPLQIQIIFKFPYFPLPTNTIIPPNTSGNNIHHNLIIHQINQSKEKREQTTRKRNVISPRNMALSLSFLHTKLPNPHHHHLSSTQTDTHLTLSSLVLSHTIPFPSLITTSIDAGGRGTFSPVYLVNQGNRFLLVSAGAPVGSTCTLRW
jgi:hypothetical protein